MLTYRNLFLIIVGMMTAIATFAIDGGPGVPRWTSDKGFWVVETNIHTPQEHTIYFYNRQGVQVYKEKLQGVRFNIHHRKTKMRLKKALEAAVIAWEQHRTQCGNDEQVKKTIRGTSLFCRRKNTVQR